MTAVPASVRAQVFHRRTRPFRCEFSHGTTMWLVDINPNAAFPRWLRPFASIRARDQFTKDDRPLPAKVRAFLDAQDVAWTADKVLMLANARSLGHVFDPLTTYFCTGRTCRSWGSTRPSGGCGSSTSPTARPASEPGTFDVAQIELTRQPSVEIRFVPCSDPPRSVFRSAPFGVRPKSGGSEREIWRI